MNNEGNEELEPLFETTEAYEAFKERMFTKRSIVWT